MNQAKFRRRILIGIVAIVIFILWVVVGCFLIGLSRSHQWLSSFVEITFALNTSMSVAKVRSLLLRPLLQKCYDMIEELKVNEKTVNVSEKTIKKLHKDAEELYKKFERRLTRELNWIVKVGLVFAVASLVTLLTDVPNEYICWIPLLMAPVAVYIAEVVLQYYIITGEFAATCEREVENNAIKKDEELNRSIDKITKSLDDSIINDYDSES